eukprot:GILJ01005960.1.p1 GENE.GILJ01005960.1~~GILJ01005960.1.p1  ORF type:complete len:1056 (+),score=190.79 GILJ01005960.1:47-3214(+)
MSCCHSFDLGNESSQSHPQQPRPAPADKDVHIVKSEHDKKEYRSIVLPNQLRVLLISEPDDECDGMGDQESEEWQTEEEDDGDDDEGDEDDDDDHSQEGDHDTADSHSHTSHEHDAEDCKKKTVRTAAAAMCVQVGSFSDPEDFQGLAHFLEHMLFLGSKKYPEQNGFDSFLTSHGGYSNAMTECEYTVYKFEVNHKHLREALDRFAQFFSGPLLTEDQSLKEMKNIDSEFQLVLLNDHTRKQQMQCHTSAPGHPYKRFSWGNLKSLLEVPHEKQSPPIHEALLHFHQKYYSANTMNLCVMGRESLDTLEEWVREMYSPVPNLSISPPFFGHFGSPFDETALSTVFKMNSIKDSHHLDLSWVLPDLAHAYKSKPYDYLAHLIGHEGPGSLLSLFRQRGWANDMLAGVGTTGYDRNTACFLFNIHVSLSDLGYEHIWEVVDFVFQYLNLLKRTGPLRWIYDELKTVADMKFKFAEKIDPVEYVEELAVSMIYHPMEHVLTGSEVFYEFDELLLARITACLNAEEVRIDICSKAIAADGPEYEPWFNVHFSRESIPIERRNSWKNPQIHESLALPEPNKFLPEDFTIKGQAPLHPPKSKSVPQIITESSLFRVWYLMDNTFLLPKANAHFLLLFPNFHSSPIRESLMDLFVELLEDSLNEQIGYFASLAGLHFTVRSKDNGLELKVYGFNDKLFVLAEELFKRIVTLSANIDVNRFNALREKLIRHLKNSQMEPSKQANMLRLIALQHDTWHRDDLVTALESATVADLQSYINETLSCTLIDALFHGNVTEQETVNAVKRLEDILTTVGRVQPLNREHFTRSVGVQLPSNKEFVLKVPARNPDNVNSVVQSYYQFYREDLKNRVIVDVFEQLIEEPWYDSLRTSQQLGYDVHCGSRITRGMCGFVLFVESAAYAPTFIEERMNEFLDKFDAHLKGLSAEDFETHIESLIEDRMEPFNNLREESGRYWDEILNGSLQFDRREQEIALLPNISLKDLREWYSKYMKPSHPSSVRRRLDIHVHGKAAPETEAETDNKATKPRARPLEPISDIYNFRQSTL